MSLATGFEAKGDATGSLFRLPVAPQDCLEEGVYGRSVVVSPIHQGRPGVLRNYSNREPLRSIFDEGWEIHGMMSCMQSSPVSPL
jgi:hypothetical protein